MPRGLFGQADAGAGHQGHTHARGPYLAVAVERAIDSGPLTYAPPEGWQGDPGTLVGLPCRAPLGRGGPARGVVVAAGGVELLGTLDPARVRPLESLGEGPLPHAVLELGRWISDYYACPLGVTLAAMLPAAVKRGVGRRTTTALRPTGLAPEGRLPPTTRAAWEAIAALDRADFPIAERELVGRLGLKNAAPVRRLVALGLLETITLSGVVARGSGTTPAAHAPPVPDIPPPPTPQQRAVIEGVPMGAFGAHLLFGVTGSGKTEVYLQLLERALAGGADGDGDGSPGGIVLVPEIALTPQLAGRFLARLGPLLGEGGVVVLHSGLAAGERHRAWDALRRGAARVVIGPRSALFAPLRRVGLIVVDEEHAPDYKQDRAPRYHGRDAAIKRAQIEGCPVVLGSATPSLESWRNAQQGRFSLWTMPERAPGSAGLPRVEVVDIAAEQRLARQRGGRMELLGPTLAGALGRALDAGGQAVLLLNRRGFARVVACPDTACGWTLSCQSCSAAMVFHRKGVVSPKGLVRCHHCLAEQLMPKTCPVCGKRTILLGRGTQRLEDELHDTLGLSTQAIARMDADTMRRAGDYGDVLARVANGTVRVLLGTQMIAKGLDFPNVRLVGVVDADTALGIADWRCQERTFQLVAQVAGRAGRGREAGRVVVQTLSPDLPAIRAAADHDYQRFAAAELPVRRGAGLPPFTRAAWIVARDRDYDKAAHRAEAIAHALAQWFGGRARVEGPAPAPLERAHDEYRVGVEVYARDAATLRAGLHALRASRGLVSDAHVAIDVDPVAIW